VTRALISSATAQSRFFVAAAALLVALVLAPQIATAEAVAYPETRDRLTSLSDQVCDQVDGELSRLSHLGYRDSYDENVVGSLLVPQKGFQHTEYFLRKEAAYQRYASRAQAAGRDVMGKRAWKGQFDARYAGFRSHMQAKYGPIQLHHLATNKNKRFTPQLEDVAGKYGLGLNESWNRLSLPHFGSHPIRYHQFVLREMRAADALARGDLGVFLNQYKIRVTDVVRSNPEMLNASWWR